MNFKLGVLAFALAVTSVLAYEIDDTVPYATVPYATVAKVELTVRSKYLDDKDIFSKSDPMCVLWMKESSTEKWVEVGRTEALQDILYPRWSKKFELDYYFEKQQFIKMEVYDVDTDSANLNEQELLGVMETPLGTVIQDSQSQGYFSSKLLNGKGMIFIDVQEVQGNDDTVQIKFKGLKLDKKDIFGGKSDPYYEISRLSNYEQFVLVYRSEVIENDLNPSWKPADLPLRQLHGGDPERPLKIEVYDWDTNGIFGGRRQFIGSFETNFNELSKASAKNTKFQLINPNKAGNKGSGELSVSVEYL